MARKKRHLVAGGPPAPAPLLHPGPAPGRPGGGPRPLVVQKVTWSGGKVPTGEDAAFHFLATANDSKTYEFNVRQAYSDGSIVDWNGPESSDTPAPAVEAR